MNRKMQILAVIASLVAVAVTAPDGSAATAVEGTYEYREVSVVSGTRFPHRYQWSQSFSAATIKQGEPLEFRALEKIEAWLWCFSYDEYDIRQTGLNFRVAYTPRGRAHPVTGEGIRLSETPYRARAWRELSNCAPSCPNGIGTCPYYGTQYHELTGTVPGSETATLKPGCYLLETHWESPPRPRRRESSKANQGPLPRFCVQAAATAPGTPTPPAPGTPQNPPQTPPPPPSSAAAPGALDTTAPTARALASAGAAGSRVRLRFVVSDNSGRTRQQIVVTSGTRVLARINRPLGASRASQIASVTYRLPRNAPAALRFCIVAWDQAGNPSAKSCARLTVI